MPVSTLPERTILGSLADFSSGLRFDSIPAEVIEHAKLVLFHNLIVAIAGRHERVAGQDASVWPDGLPSSAVATRLTDGLLGPSNDTVFTNALAMGVRAQHDEHPKAFSHFGSSILPALMAVAEQTRMDGRHFLAAMVSGYEVGAAIGTASAPQTTQRGFRATGLYGPFAAATACAKGRGCDAEQIRNALGLAASTSAGINQMWLRGTDEWRYQTASAGRNGFIAASLAADGATGAPDALEGAAGFYRAFAGEVIEAPSVIEGLGREWATHQVKLKPYPVCAVNQAPVQVAIELLAEHRLAAQDVEKVGVVLHPLAAGYPGVDAPGVPATSSAALMSLQFCMGAALVHGDVDLAHLRSTEDPAVLDMAGRVNLTADPAVSPSHAAAVQLTLRDGRQVDSGEVREARYDRESSRELASRLRSLTGMRQDEIDALESFVFDLEACGNAADLIQHCLPSEGRSARGGA